MKEPIDMDALPSIKVLARYHGPNPYSTSPVVVFQLLAPESGMASLLAGADHLARAFPEWLARVDEGRLDIEALTGALAAWSLGALNEVRGLITASGCSGDRLWLGFHDPKVTTQAVVLATKAAYMAGRDADFTAQHMQADLAGFWQVCRARHPDYQARILMQAANRTGVPYLPFMAGSRLWQFGWGCRSRVFFESMSNGDGCIARLVSSDKVSSKRLFDDFGVPSPKHWLAGTPAELAAAVSAIGYPCVVKPMDSGGGKGVTAAIRDFTQAEEAFAFARRYSSKPIMVEEMVPGDDHRLVVVGGGFVAAIKRIPAWVVGDGRRAVRALVDDLNGARNANMVKSNYHRPITFDRVLEAHLASQGFSLDTVLAEGARAGLRSNSNLSTGGICIDMTDEVHPVLKEMVEQMALSIGFQTAGFDYLSTDIAGSPWQTGGAFIEMNLTPGLDAMIAAGWSAEKIGEIVLGADVGRIPATLVVFDSVADAARWFDDAGHRVNGQARVMAGKVRLGRAEYEISSGLPWAGVAAALRNRAAEAIEVVCTPHELAAFGLPLDHFDHVILRCRPLPQAWLGVVEACTSSIES
jgi:cyanophycin synthetase